MSATLRSGSLGFAPRETSLASAFRSLAFDRRREPLAEILIADHPHVRFFVMRHGESLGQIDITAYKTPGDAAIPLTEWGELQSYGAGLHLRNFAGNNFADGFEIISSTCLRTRQTAEQVASALGNDLVVARYEDQRLDKQLFGLFSGLFSDREKELLYPAEFADYQKQLTEKGLFYARPAGGESIADVQSKATDFVWSILNSTPYDKPRDVVIVTHGLVALCIENALLHHGANWVLANMDRGANGSTKLIEDIDGHKQAIEIGQGVKRSELKPDMVAEIIRYG